MGAGPKLGCPHRLVGCAGTLRRARLAGVAAYLGADQATVASCFEGSEEADVVDDSFAGQEAALIADPIRRQIRGIGDVDVTDHRSERGNFIGAPAGVVPMPGVDEQANVGTAGAGELCRVGQAPDEFMRAFPTTVQRSQNLDREVDALLPQDPGDGGNAPLQGWPQRGRGQLTRGRDRAKHRSHPDPRGESRQPWEIVQIASEALLIEAELKRQRGGARRDSRFAELFPQLGG